MNPGAPVSVDGDSLEAMVRFLSIDPATLEPRSRFVLREAEIRLVADSLAARLARYLGASVDRIPFGFNESYYSGDSTFSAENIVARLAGTGESHGVVLITAHYDAIALQTAGFRDHWETWPAPGADDNATGVAAVMEIARVLAGRSLPYDILFVLFSAEELDKRGSTDLAARFESLYGDTILAMLNFDMLGYRPPGLSAYRDPVILSNYLSGWLADLIAAHASAVEPPLPLRVVKPGSSGYDHEPFWKRGIPAITMTESLTEDGRVGYPRYHTVGDTIGFVDFALVETIANEALDFLLDLAGAPAEIAVLPSDILLTRSSLATGVRLFETGDSIGVLARVRNTGCLVPPAGASVRLTVTLENAKGTRALFSGAYVPPPGPLAANDTMIPLVLAAGDIGENRIRGSIRVSGMEDDGADNAAEERFGVEGGGSAVLSHGFRPNPVSGSFGGSSFCLNLASEIDCSIEVYTLEGERVGIAYAGAQWGKPLAAGMNCLDCAALFPSVGELSSGVYLYRVTIYGQGGSGVFVTGRFAMEN